MPNKSKGFEKPSEILKLMDTNQIIEVLEVIEWAGRLGEIDKLFISKEKAKKELKEKIRLRDCWKAHEFDKIVDEVIK